MLDVIVTNLTNITLHMPKHLVRCISSNSMVNITDLEQVDEDRHQTVDTMQVPSKRHVQEN